MAAASVLSASLCGATAAAAYLTVTSPNGGESWPRGTSHDITWDSDAGGDVRVWLYKGGGFDRPLTQSTPNDGSYTWDIPADLAPATDYLIYVQSTADASVYDYGDANFAITASQYIQVLSPDGGEVWTSATTHTILWDSDVGGDVSIDLYKGGVLDSVIAASTPNDGSYVWAIPASQAFGTDYRIMLTSTSNGSINDSSNADFEIPGYVTVTSPNGGESWPRGTSHDITWDSATTGTDVRIWLYKGGVFDRPLTQSTPNDGSYTWDIPADLAPATDYLIWVQSTANSFVYDYGDANFAVTDFQYIQVLSPDGGEVWTSATTHTILWDSDVGGDVSIDLYKGGVLDSVIAASTPNDGSYIWAIPASQAFGTDYRIMLTSTSNGSIVDSSNADFEIPGYVTVTSPNGGESWPRGTSHDITWDSATTGTDVRIWLYKGGVFDRPLTQSTPNDGSYTWDIPADLLPATDYLIWVQSTANSFVYDYGDANFAVTETAAQPVPISPGAGLAIALLIMAAGALAAARMRTSRDGAPDPTSEG